MSTKRYKRRKRNLKKLTLAILLFFIINEKKHLINSPIIILVLGTIFILLGIIIFCWEIFLK